MNAKHVAIFTTLVLTFSISRAQKSETRWIKHQISTLSGPSMHGRGYVNKGGEKAAAFIRRNFKEFGLLPFEKDSTYYQPYTMSINTFPGDVLMKINKKILEPGPDFIVYGGSSQYNTEEKRIKLHRINLGNVKDSAAWAKVKSKFDTTKAYYLKNSDTVTKYLKQPSMRTFAKEFPAGLFILPKHGKLTWTANMETVPATIIYAEDTVLPKHPRRAAVRIETKFIPAFKNQNVLGYVPGTEKPDSFIVFTAHYDHLGRMGKDALFPGAHDNASGTALVLYLARYFAAHPQKYSIGFMLFSGEEAGLVGSKHYAAHPVFPLSQIRQVVNLDMVGDAKNGITIVNGDTREKEFAMLEDINSKKAYVPKIVKRSQTQNSDHYSFSEKGVPAIFIYGNGTKPYYHDVFDKAAELSMENIDGLAKLLEDFTGSLQGK